MRSFKSYGEAKDEAERIVLELAEGSQAPDGLAEIRHVAATPLEMPELLLGQQAALIRQYSHGIDERSLVPVRESQKTSVTRKPLGRI